MPTARVCARCRKMNPADAESCMDCGANIYHAAVVEVEDPHPVVDRLRCPDCGVPMHSGGLFIHLPAFGWTWETLASSLIFRLGGQRKQTTVLEYGQKRASARCPDCGGIWIGATSAR